MAGYAVACVVGGIAVVYACGVPWLASVAKMDLGKAALAVAVFVPGDLIKAAVAAWWRRAWRASGPCRAVEARGRTHEDRNPQLTHGAFQYKFAIDECVR